MLIVQVAKLIFLVLSSFFVSLIYSLYILYFNLFDKNSQEFFIEKVKIFFVMLRKVDKSMFSTFEKIKELCKQQGISLNTLEEKLNYPRNTLYRYKTQTPSSERVSEIADYFNVSTDYLLGRTDNPKLYTSPDGKEVDLSDLKNRVVLFDGKPLSDEDVYKIEQIIKLSIGVTGGENK